MNKIDSLWSRANSQAKLARILQAMWAEGASDMSDANARARVRQCTAALQSTSAVEGEAERRLAEL